MPVLTGGPFRYQVHADTYLRAALGHTKAAVKQAVIAPSALSLLYPPADLDGYPRQAFLRDLINEAETDIRNTLEAGAHVVQLDFTEGRLSLKLDPSGGVLDNLIALNNQVLERFSDSERSRIGVHTCPGGDQDSTHSLDIDYAGLLPRLFQLKAGNFYIQLASEAEPEKVLAIAAEHLPPGARVFIGVTDPIDPRVETPELVRDRILAAARQLPPDRIGTCDDCGFAPFADDTSTSRDIAFAKISSAGRGDGSRGPAAGPVSSSLDRAARAIVQVSGAGSQRDYQCYRMCRVRYAVGKAFQFSLKIRQGQQGRQIGQASGAQGDGGEMDFTWPPPPTSRCRLVQGSGSSVSATATACRNHLPSGTLGSQYGCVRCDVTSSKVAACGRRCRIRVSKIPTYTRATAYPSGSRTVPIAAPSGTGESGSMPHALTRSWCDAWRNRLGEMPTLSVKWLVNEPRLL